ncbi:hypothetical protein [Shewanella algae]|uniref:hypothetical protein n=1 Tax=Shewanella algae TaxID=38313 RepID=UPI002358CCCF|nr:hypothetical protein [Shewanella algae]MDC8854235.1 hypothetical protein [Shewanella algae]
MYILLILMFISFPLFADTHNEIQCFSNGIEFDCTSDFNLKEDLKIQVIHAEGNNKNVHIKEIPQVEMISKTSLKDYSSMLIAFIALIGTGLSIYNLLLIKENRNNDKEAEKFYFWMKEIVFPDYISKIIKETSTLGNEYSNLNSLSMKNKEVFLDNFRDMKGVTLPLISNGTNLPYFSEYFKEIHKIFLTLEDEINQGLFHEEIEHFGDENSKQIELTGNEFNEFISVTLNNLSLLQSKYK